MRNCIAAALLLAPSLALAGGYAVPNTSPRDLGLCASAVAAQRDAGAAFALPAALARIAGPSARAGGGAVNVFNSWKDPTPGATEPPLDTTALEPGSAHLNLQFTGFPNVAASYGTTLQALGNRRVGAGLSFQPFGGAVVKWPDDWAGRYRITTVDRRVFSGIASAGIELVPQVRVGGGLVYYYTMEKFTQNAWMQPYPLFGGTATAPDASGHLELSGGALTFDLSAEIDPLPGIPLTVGVDYKHKATQHLRGDVSWTGTDPYFSGDQLAPLTALFTATGASQTLTIPNMLNVGVAYRAMTPLLVTFAYTFDRWVVYDRDAFVANTGAQIDVSRDYRNGHTFRAGVEYDLFRAVQLRGGVQRDISGMRTATYSPTLPDASSWGGSLGATYKFARGVYADAAVFYAKMDKVEVTAAGSEPIPSYNPATYFPSGTFRGDYQASALIYGFSVGWTPGTRTGE